MLGKDIIKQDLGRYYEMLDKLKGWIHQRRIYYSSEKVQRERLWLMGIMLVMMVLAILLFSAGSFWVLIFSSIIFTFTLIDYLYVRWKTKGTTPNKST